MTDFSGPQPQRIGDAERDRATEYLRDHLAEGRLDQTEFDDRISRALTARTQADLDPLFMDLPGPKPGDAVAPAGSFQAPPWQGPPSQEVTARPTAQVPEQSKLHKTWMAASAIAWPAALIVCFATHWQFWWIMLIPIFFPWWLGHGDQGDDRRNRNRNNHRRHHRRY